MMNLRTIQTFQTRTVAGACQDPRTRLYITRCLSRFYRGDYGEIPQEDADLNNADLKAGEGHVLARYKASHNLDRDIYIESCFSQSNPDVLDCNYTMIMYCDER